MRRSRRPRIVRPAPLRASLAALGAFALIALLDEPTAADRALYEWAGRYYDRRLELVQRPLEWFGLPGVYIPCALILARQLRRRGRPGGATIASGALSGWLALRLTRLFVYRPRPPRPPGRGPKRESTFPSGHTTGTTALALVGARVLHDERVLKTGQAWFAGVGLPLLVGANRVYVREHWLTDVVAGWALGTSVAIAVLALRGTKKADPSSLRSSG